MKTLKLASLFLGLSLLLSCSKDNDPKTETVNLQNDGYVEQGNRTFIGADTAGEEYAVTLGPVSSTFQVTFVTFLFGGTGQMVVQRNVILKIYKDNGSIIPDDLLYSGDYTFASSNTLLQQIDVRDESIIYEGGGSIRVSFEFVDGISFPSFAQEYDGIYDPNRNWIKESGGLWKSNDSIGLDGNWVIRAIVEQNI